MFCLTVVPIQIALGIGHRADAAQAGLSGFLRTLTRASLVIPLATHLCRGRPDRAADLQPRFRRRQPVPGVVGIGAVEWLGRPTSAFIAIVVMDIWQWTPFVALIFLAGLSMVPVEIEEAARLETKSHWALLRYVQLPYLLPGLTAVLILRSADVLKLFDMVFVMTRGGPGAATDWCRSISSGWASRCSTWGSRRRRRSCCWSSPSCSRRIYIRIFYREIDHGRASAGNRRRSKLGSASPSGWSMPGIWSGCSRSSCSRCSRSTGWSSTSLKTRPSRWPRRRSGCLRRIWITTTRSCSTGMCCPA